jgi:hypothetical protein
MNRIKARLKETSQSWISSIILVLNLVKLAGEALLCLSFSARVLLNPTLIAMINKVCNSLKTKNQSSFNAGLVLRI